MLVVELPSRWTVEENLVLGETRRGVPTASMGLPHRSVPLLSFRTRRLHFSGEALPFLNSEERCVGRCFVLYDVFAFGSALHCLDQLVLNAWWLARSSTYVWPTRNARITLLACFRLRTDRHTGCFKTAQRITERFRKVQKDCRTLQKVS